MTTYQYGYITVRDLGPVATVETIRGLEADFAAIPRGATTNVPLVDILSTLGARGWQVSTALAPRPVAGDHPGVTQYFLVKELRDAS